MKLNTNSNSYTIIYAAIVVVVVAFLLAFSFSALKERSDANERIDKKQQILSALNLRDIEKSDVEKKYEEVVEADEITNVKGEILNAGKDKDKAGFKVDRKEMGPDKLPVFVCKVKGETKYVVPMVGKGLWGSIWGFIALNADGKTVFGCYFSHESETAGLGALIKEAKFQDEFKGKTAYGDDGEELLSVVKCGTVEDSKTQCDGITGATLTSKGVNSMLHKYLKDYAAYLGKMTGNGVDK